MKIKMSKLKNGDFFTFEGYTYVKTPEGAIDLNNKEYKVFNNNLTVESVEGAFWIGDNLFYSKERQYDGAYFNELPDGTWIAANGRKYIKINSRMVVDLKSGEIISYLEEYPIKVINREREAFEDFYQQIEFEEEVRRRLE